MAGINKVILVGNVGKDPETRSTAAGKSVTNVTVATSESWTDKNTGNKEEKTEWHRVVFFDRQADLVQQYVQKGSKIYVEGKLVTRTWEQDGVKRFATEIHAREIQFLSPSAQQQPASSDNYDEPTQQQRTPPQRQPQQQNRPQQRQPPKQDNYFDDDIPF